MADVADGGDDLRNPGLNDPEDLSDVAARVDEAQGFQVEEPLPGEDEPDDGYERAVGGRDISEPAADADIIDRGDVEAGLADPYTPGST